MSTLLLLVVAVTFAPAALTQDTVFAKGDVVRLVTPPDHDPLPDCRILAVAGDRVHATKSGLTVNGSAVRGLSRELLQTFGEPWDQVVPAGHYFVVGERQNGQNSTVRYQGLIPAAKIAGLAER